MVKLLSVISIFLLFFTGITASISGFMLMYDPTGKPLSMNTSILISSPFETFFVPGIILFLAIGISSILIAFVVMNDMSYSTKLLMYQGIVMAGWIIVQLIMIKQFHFLQVIYLLIAAELIYTGYSGMQQKSSEIRNI